MIIGYYVHYYLGNKKENPYKLWIAAYDADDAVQRCAVQAGHRHGYSYKVTVTKVTDENGKELIKPVPVEDTVPEINSMDLMTNLAEINKLMQGYKSMGKRHTRHSALGGLVKW
jgi:hypothetical protein